MTCQRCNGTGSLSRDLHADLDCIHCEVAVERARFNIWVQKNVPYACLVDAWVIRQYVMCNAACAGHPLAN